MKKHNLFVISLLLILGCGKQHITHRDNTDKPGPGQVAPSSPVPTPGPKPVSASVNCDLEFAPSGFCGGVLWKAAPSPKTQSFEIQLWKKDDTSRSLANPSEKVSAFFVMQCCGHSSPVELKEISPGTFQTTGTDLTPGEYVLYVAIGTASPVKASSVLELR